MKKLTFPDLSFRLQTSPDGPLVDLSTFNPDADDDGRPRDFGVAILEGGSLVGDGTRDGWDPVRLGQLLSLLEHAPELFDVLQRLVAGEGPVAGVHPLRRAERVLKQIANGELVYGADPHLRLALGQRREDGR